MPLRDATLPGGLERIAATETSTAFSDEHASATDDLKERTEARLLPLLFKLWDSTLDKRTCPRCASASGTILPWGLSFPQGVPGEPHPFCRCREATIFLPIGYQKETEPA